MKCIILAAGYATRLYPLTKNKPKPLLDIAGKPILEYILEKVWKVTEINEVFIVTNEKFYSCFNEWKKGYGFPGKIHILNDGTTTNENRLGAIADLQYTIDKAGIDEEILVLAGDNLFDFELYDFVEFYRTKASDCITVHELNDIERLKRSGVIEVDEQWKVISFEEKPENPKTNLAVPPFYIYKKETLPLISEYLIEGNNPDAPGNFIPWLIKKKDVYAYKFEGERYDIGTLAIYNKVRQYYSDRSWENPNLKLVVD